MEERRQSLRPEDDENSVVEDEEGSVVDLEHRNVDKNDLKEFILLFETCPSLWNPRDKHYLDTLKKNEDIQKLLPIYKNIKPNATKEDVKKKINSLRSNYRKELKKIENSKRSGCGADQVYKPTSSTFHLLQFLAKIEKPKMKKDDDLSEIRSDEDNSLVISSITNESPPVKIRKKSGTLAKQNELLNRACSLLSQPSVSTQQDVNPLALVWSDKLRSLHPTQKLYAEKAIHDILFEAQLNNLHRYSIQINAYAPHSSPSTSTPYTFTPSPGAHVPENSIPDNCETYKSPGTANNLHRHSVQITASAPHSSPATSTRYTFTPSPGAHVPENSIPDNCETYKSPGTAYNLHSHSVQITASAPHSSPATSTPYTFAHSPGAHEPENSIPDNCETYKSPGTANNLHRHSVQITASAPHSSPATSTPYTFAHSPGAHEPENSIPDNCETYKSPGTANNLHRHSVQITASAPHSSPATYTPYTFAPSPVAYVPDNLVPDNCKTYTPPGTFITYPPVIHIPESNIPFVHAKASTSTTTHQKPKRKKPSSTITTAQNYQTDKKVQSGHASEIVLQLNSETSNSDEYTVGSLFATFKPT